MKHQVNPSKVHPELCSQKNFLIMSGPAPLPFIGNLHQVFANETIAFLALHNALYKKYGNMVTFWAGPQKQCLVSGYEELKEIMHNPLFDNRVPQDARKRVFDEVYQDQSNEENQSKLRL